MAGRVHSSTEAAVSPLLLAVRPRARFIIRLVTTLRLATPLGLATPFRRPVLLPLALGTPPHLLCASRLVHGPPLLPSGAGLRLRRTSCLRLGSPPPAVRVGPRVARVAGRLLLLHPPVAMSMAALGGARRMMILRRRTMTGSKGLLQTLALGAPQIFRTGTAMWVTEM